MPFMGALKLQHLCTGLLIDFRDCLEDVGDTPLELLQPVLLQCNAEQLASIEDGTRSGGRDLREALQPHWHRVFVNDFGGWNRDSDQACHYFISHFCSMSSRSAQLAHPAQQISLLQHFHCNHKHYAWCRNSNTHPNHALLGRQHATGDSCTS